MDLLRASLSTICGQLRTKLIWLVASRHNRNWVMMLHNIRVWVNALDKNRLASTKYKSLVIDIKLAPYWPVMDNSSNT